ncbi:MAG TPA: hypothetical protein VN018_07785 [Brevundimonas sp.]|nr:hypothetical protein [Brevundimonas sp.]
MASEYSPLGSAATSVMSGRAQSRQFGMEGLMYEKQAKDVDLQATQASARRREELRASLSSVTATRAARGLSLDTPSGMAIERELRRQSVSDEGAENLGFKNQSYALRTTAAMRRRGASNANATGWLQAAGSIMDAAGNIASVGKPPSKGGK